VSNLIRPYTFSTGGQMRGISGHVCASNGYHSKLSYLCAISENAWQLPNRFQANLRALTALFKPKIWECWRYFLFSFSFFPALTPVAKMRAAASTCIGESEVGALAIAARRFVFANLRQGAPQAPVSAFSPCTWHNLADRFQSGTRSPWRRKQGEGC